VRDVDRRVADLDGLPRKNGELVFEAPWQGRAFGMAVALSEQGAYAWDDFREKLVAEIAHGDGAAYYSSWLEALSELLLERGILTEAEVSRRTGEFARQERDEIF
jgi:nitrile hydratase accessory protein